MQTLYPFLTFGPVKGSCVKFKPLVVFFFFLFYFMFTLCSWPKVAKIFPSPLFCLHNWYILYAGFSDAGKCVNRPRLLRVYGITDGTKWKAHPALSKADKLHLLQWDQTPPPSKNVSRFRNQCFFLCFFFVSFCILCPQAWTLILIICHAHTM